MSIAIISILLALTAAGVFQVIQSQRESTTKTTMQAVNKVLTPQMKWVFDKANKETPPPSVIALAGNDAYAPMRAQLIWRKLRLKQEFPMSFAEAKQPWLTFGGASVGISPTDLPSKYAKPLASLTSANTAATPFLESSICLLLALQTRRDGVALNVDELGSSAVNLNGIGLKALVDGWGNPIAFFRFPTSNDALIVGNNALDASNPAGPNDTTAVFRDPYDSQGLLVNPSWNNYASWKVGGPVAAFEQMCHVVHTPNSTTATNLNYQIWPRYMVPVLVSSGRDGKWGLNSAFSPTPQVGINPDMSIDPASPADGYDNIYSYQLQQ